MCYTLGCSTEHVTSSVRDRVTAAMAADQGEQTYTWDWPITTNMQAAHHRPLTRRGHNKTRANPKRKGYPWGG